MIVKKFKLNGQTQQYEPMRDITGIDAETVMAKSFIDLPIEVTADKQLYLYEAGEMVGDRFIHQFVWHSENPNLFD